MPGVLSIVATPIGNLGDISYRAVRTLQEADLIACEDTRHTRQLLDHYDIRKPLVSYHDHNEREKAPKLLEWLQSGKNIALVSDAGTPLISDPGYRIVEAAVSEGISVISIPGPSAAVTALAASGLTTDSFFFGGFLPAKKSPRKRALEAAAEMGTVLIYYEAPHRLLEALADVAEVLPNRQVVVARELTKLHEEYIRGTAADILSNFGQTQGIRGEITLLIGRAHQADKDPEPVPDVYRRYISAGMPRMDAMKATARECGISKREVYAELEKGGGEPA